MLWQIIGPYQWAFNNINKILNDIAQFTYIPRPVMFFFSGQIPIDPAIGKLVEGDVSAQAEQACKNVMALLESQGLTAANVVKTTVFITDMGNFAAVNEVYKKYFTAPCPARSCVEVSKLPLGAQVEIEAIATL